MAWTRWLPLRFIIRRAAQSQGFLDPIELLARLRSFAQPSEVGEPVELLRAGAVFHARGLINSKVIQHNLDWVWPYWIWRQYSPLDRSFLPRAFSISHINLTHRNWTAIGHPDCQEIPLVDPRGMLTPFFDGWSLDCWVLDADGAHLLPPRADSCRQIQLMTTGLAVCTETKHGKLSLTTESEVVLEQGQPVCVLRVTAQGLSSARLAVVLRPLNPEGISFIERISLSADRRRWTVDATRTIEFSDVVETHRVSDYSRGDVFSQLDQTAPQNALREEQEISCKVGLATAAAVFPLQADTVRRLTVRLPLHQAGDESCSKISWHDERSRCCQLICPDPHYQMLYDAALTSVILHSPGDVYPGPYTYKRFWFRDAAFIVHALLCAGLNDRAERALIRFFPRQTPLGYFRSQEGEWDANGEVLWILSRFQRLTGKALSAEWHANVARGAHWIVRKRLADDIDAPHAGLLPPGFSAEHLGLNDYYYWDDFWGVAGLRSAASLLADADMEEAEKCRREADLFEAAIERSLRTCEQRLGRPAMPASPYRRLDSGAIGSLAVGYPLQSCTPKDPRLLDCIEFLLQRCFVKGTFFQDMIHSGLNAYLTLQVAQVLLRAGDSRYLDLVDSVAALASPTGQWPEAIHPGTGGGCMGDGHHVWASAEWILMIRNCFVREEEGRLILCSGIPPRWLTQNTPVSFGPAPTEFGTLSITVYPISSDKVQVQWKAQWHADAPALDIKMATYEAATAANGEDLVILTRQGAAA